VRAGLKPGHRVANLMASGELYSGMLFMEHGLHASPVENVRFPVGHATPDEAIAELIANFQIQVLVGEPMKLSAVAECVLKRDQDAGSVELVLFAGDLMFDDLRPILAKAFPQATVASIGLASVDAGLVAAPVPGPDVRVHEEFANRTLVEIVDDETGEPITVEGVPGRLIVTNLFRTLMPIIRYPVGDRAEWADVERRHFRLVGRSAEGARVGTIAMPTEDVRAALTAADPDHFMTGMQMVQRRWDGRDGLILRLGYTEQPPPELTARLLAAVHAARPDYEIYAADGMIHELVIEWVPRGELVTNPRTGKLRQVLDERPSA